MALEQRLTLSEIERRVCDVASEQLAIDRVQVSRNDRLIEELHCDSLDFVELLMELEEHLDVTLPAEPPNAIYKAVFTRQPFRLSDLAEAVYLQQGTGTPDRRLWRKTKEHPAASQKVPFTQLDGTWQQAATGQRPLIECLESSGETKQYRRRSDGMRLIRIPSAEVEIGANLPGAQPDEKPMHVVEMDSFLIDAEPVSVTAFCRFLNSIGDTDPTVLSDWFVLASGDKRRAQMIVEQTETGWQPVRGTERWPMILVSWFGANAYSLWANGDDWTAYGDDRHGFLPTEAQWEYAARGPRYQQYPWGDEQPTLEKMRYGQHRKGLTYRADSMPMADVNNLLGMSPFGLHHMAGNVWQWCRDWYDEEFYSRPEASERNPLNRTATQVKSERGGSWIGPAELCRSSFRRGRPPNARGRCLGFRCVSGVP